MSKQDYELIAATIKQVLNVHPHAIEGIAAVADALAADFRSINPNFNRARFLHACGLPLLA